MPRDETHLTVAFRVATEEPFSPIGGGDIKSSADYMTILGIQPVIVGQTCMGSPFNNADWPGVGVAQRRPVLRQQRRHPDAARGEQLRRLLAVLHLR